MTNRQKTFRQSEPSGSTAVSDYLWELRLMKYVNNKATGATRDKLHSIVLTASRPFFKTLCDRFTANPKISIEDLFKQVTNTYKNKYL